MRRTWRATGTAVGLALATLQSAAHAQTYYGTAQPDAAAATLIQTPASLGSAPIYDPASASTVVSPAAVGVAYGSAPVEGVTVLQPLVTAPAPVVSAPVRAPLPTYSAAPPVPAAAPALAPAPVQAAAQEVIQLTPIEIEGAAPAAANVTEVEGERLFLEGGVKLDDTLREIPGVFTRVNAGQPGVAVNIRGFEGSGRVNVTVDGAPQNFRFTGHEAQGYAYVDQNLLAGVDVTRGADASKGGFAGSVDLRTLGVSDLVRDGRNSGALSRLSWGANGAGFSGMVGGGLRYDGLGLAGAISTRDSKNYRTGNDTLVANSGNEVTSGLVKAEFNRGGDHSANLGAVLYETEFAANSYRQTLNNNTFTGGYRYNPENELIDLRVDGYVNDTKTHYDSAITSGSAVGRVIRNQGVGGSVENRSLASFGDVDLVSTNGLSYRHEELHGHNGGVNPDNGETSTWAAFSDNKLKYGVFDAGLGLRYDHFSVDGDGFDKTGTPYAVDISTGRLNPTVEIGVEPIPGVRPYVKWSQSMRSPTLNETMLGGGHPPAAGATPSTYDPNPNLRPERLTTVELGAQVARDDLLLPGDRLSANANYYWSSVDDYVISEIGAQVRFINAPGKSKVEGFELGATYDAGPWFARAAYAHSDSKLPAQTTGFGAGQYQADDMVSLTAGARLLDRHLTLGGTYNYVSGGGVASFVGGQAAQGRNENSYELLDLFADYRVNDHFSFGVKASNILDKQFTPWLSTSGAGRGRTLSILGEARF